MPEEKVSNEHQYHGIDSSPCTVCGISRGIHGVRTNTGQLVPPAADAGPRQPDEHIGKLELRDGALWQCVGNAEHGGLRWKLVLTSALVQSAIAAPPVPQEAAPAPGTVATFMDMRLDTTMPVGQVDVQDSKGRRTIIPATAPDSAMRVAEQITQSGYLRTADIAALIREAGSERERRLLNWFIKYAEDAEKSWTKDGERTVTAMSWGQAVSEFRAAASRLLGGESK